MDVLSPAPRPEWLSVLQSDIAAVPEQHPGWLDAACSLSGFEDASRLYDFGGGRRLVLPLVKRSVASLPIHTAASFPWGWGMGGLLAPGGATSSEMKQIFEDLRKLPYVRIQIRPNPLCNANWAAAAPNDVIKIPRRSHILDLSGGFENVWNSRFPSTTRAKIRKSERENVVVKSGTDEELAQAFYELFQRSVDRWATRQNEPLALARWRQKRNNSLDRFTQLAKKAEGIARWWVAWHEGTPAAAILVLKGEHNAHVTRGAMNRDLAAKTKANYLLHSLAIQDACESGCHSFHFGEAGNSESLAKFKESFGSKPFEYCEYRIERLPLTRIDGMLRSTVKRLLGFRDT